MPPPPVKLGLINSEVFVHIGYTLWKEGSRLIRVLGRVFGYNRGASTFYNREILRKNPYNLNL